MKLIQLRYFAGIVEAGSFTGASRQMNVAQSALSRQMRELEQRIGVQLLNRNHGGATLTDAGQRLYSRVHAILELVETAQNEARSGASGNPAGIVRVALSVGVAGLIGPKLVQRVAEIYPDIYITIVDGMGYQTGEVIENGQVDFGLVPNAERLNGIRAQPIVEEQFYLASRRQGKTADIRDISLRQVEKLPLVMPGRAVHLRHHVEAAVARSGRKLNVRYEQQSLVTILSLVSAGVCSAIINWPAVHELWAEGKLDVRRIVKPELTRIFSLAVPVARPLSGAAGATYEVLYQLLIEQVKVGNWKGRLVPEDLAHG